MARNASIFPMFRSPIPAVHGPATRSMALPILSALTILCGIAAPAWLPTPALAQGSGEEADASSNTSPEVAADFFDVVDVQIVNVEVVVTDRDGEPVPGLGIEDFEILDDGEPVQITNFYASEGVLERAPEQTVDPIARANEEPLPVPPDQRLNLVIFIDNENISPQNRNRVIEALRGSVFFSLAPTDRVTVVSYDGSINIRQNLTSDPNKLARTLDDMTKGSSRGRQQDLERISILRELQRVNDGSGAGPGTGFQEDTVDWQSILSSIRTYAEQEYGDVVRTAQVLGSFVDSLSGLTGRKVLVYVSDGLSMRPGEALFQSFDRMVRDSGGVIRTPFNAESESRQFDAAPVFETLGKRANASRVTFYTIMATGGRSRALTPAERSAFVDMSASAVSMGQVWDDGLDEIETSNYRASMETLAAATGGRSTLSTRDFGGALRSLKKDLRTYYSLGYEARDADGRNHRIRVRMKDRSLEARHRESYRQRTVEERMSVRTQSALLFGASENPLGVRVDFGPARKAEKGQILVPVIVKFPLSQVVLTPGESNHQGRVTIYVGARAVEGGLSPVQTMPAPISIPNDKVLSALEQVAGYRMMLLLRPGQHLVAVTVRDDLAQVESSTLASYQAEVPKDGPTESP